MSETTTVRVSRLTHEELRRIAEDSHETVAETVARGVRLLRQERLGLDLSLPLTQDEVDWLDADAG